MSPRRVWDVEEIPVITPWISGIIVIGFSTLISLAIVWIVGGL